MIINMQIHRVERGYRSVGSGLTSVGVLSLQTLSIQYVDLSDQLRVTTHSCPTGLRRIVQSQLSGNVYGIVRELYLTDVLRRTQTAKI